MDYFDLDTKALKKYYSGKNYRKAYKDIKTFLCDNGFTHRQWSGYVSKEALSASNLRAKILNLSLNYFFCKKIVSQ